jgi:TRAP-type mannitol/chloroaromatic compound transport system permease large subunit
VLVLLSLQASFLLPPFGYALMMARSAMKEAVPLGSVLRSLAPFLAVQALVLIAVFLFPELVHVGGATGL